MRLACDIDIFHLVTKFTLYVVEVLLFEFSLLVLLLGRRRMCSFFGLKQELVVISGLYRKRFGRNEIHFT